MDPRKRMHISRYECGQPVSTIRDTLLGRKHAIPIFNISLRGGASECSRIKNIAAREVKAERRTNERKKEDKARARKEERGSKKTASSSHTKNINQRQLHKKAKWKDMRQQLYIHIYIYICK